MSKPRAKPCQNVGIPMRIMEFWTMTMSSVPSMTPVSEPLPPVMAVPPRTTAAMTIISMPSRLVGCICPMEQVRTMPARAAMTPTRT